MLPPWRATQMQQQQNKTKKNDFFSIASLFYFDENQMEK